MFFFFATLRSDLFCNAFFIRGLRSVTWMFMANSRLVKWCGLDHLEPRMRQLLFAAKGTNIIPPRYHSDIQSQIIRRPWRPLTGDGIKAVKGLWGHVNQSGLNDLEHFSFCWSKKIGAQQTSWFIMIYHDIQLKSWNPWMNLGGSEALKAPQRSLAAKNAPSFKTIIKMFLDP